MTRSKIVGLGSYVPPREVTNDEIQYLDATLQRQPERTIDTGHDWIVERTGIETRRYAEPGVATSDLAVHAARAALDDAGLAPSDVDALIVGTLSPDQLFPGTGVYVQRKLEMGHFPACYDIRQQCSAFLYGLQMADGLIRSGIHRTVLLIGAEVHSHGLDFSTRGRDVTVLFGDGAGAVVLQASDSGDAREGVLYTSVHADGAGAELLEMQLFDIGSAPIITYAPEDIETNAAMYPQMDGRKVFVNAIKRMTESVVTALQRTGLTWDDVDWFVPHQANMRISQQVADKAQIPQDKVLHSIQHYGNTTAATIPLTLDHHRQAGRVKTGDLVVSAVFGSGFTWGAAVYRLG